MPGNQAAYGAQKCESGLSAVSLFPCGDSGFREKEKEIGGKIRTEKWLQRVDRSK